MLTLGLGCYCCTIYLTFDCTFAGGGEEVHGTVEERCLGLGNLDSQWN